MALALRRGGVVVHLRHALIFYGDPPTAEPGGQQGSSSINSALEHWKLNCSNAGEKALYERLIREQLIRRYDLQDIRLVHVHDDAEMQAGFERYKDIIWDVVGWVGHATYASDDFLPTLDEKLPSGKVKPGTIITGKRFNSFVKGLPQPPREFLVIGCDAAQAGGLGQSISAAFPRALVVAGVKKSHIVFDFPDDESLSDRIIPGVSFNRVQIEGNTVTFRGGRRCMEDADAAAELQAAIDEPQMPLDAASLRSAKIVVSVKHAIVTLSGEVPGPSARATALRITINHELTATFVKEIIDKMHDSLGISMGDPSEF